MGAHNCAMHQDPCPMCGQHSMPRRPSHCGHVWHACEVELFPPTPQRTEDTAKLVAKASLMYMQDAGVYHVINLARQIVDQLAPAAELGSCAHPELVAALTVVLLDQNRTERSGVVERAELDAMMVGTGFVKVERGAGNMLSYSVVRPDQVTLRVD